jgi:hypothetical protein
MKGMIITKTIIPGDKAWEAWIKTGSLYKAPLYLYTTYGIKNPRTQKPVSHAGVAGACNKHMVADPVGSKKMLEEVYRANGEILTERVWGTLLYKALLYTTPRKQKEFLEKHTYYKPLFDEIRNANIKG